MMKMIDELRIESEGRTKLLWANNYWDGPLCGIMLWDSEKAYYNYYEDKSIHIPFDGNQKELKEWKEDCRENGWKFYIKDMDGYEHHRYFKVYKLDEDTLDALFHNHAMFRKYVGTHTDYDANGDRGIGAEIKADGKIGDLGDLMPYSEHHKFFDNKQKDYNLDLENREVLGKFKMITGWS